MAKAVVRGAQQEPNIRVQMKHAAKTEAEDVLGADAYVFLTPENLASMAGMMKDFFDRTYYSALDKIQGRPFAVAVCAGSDGSNAVKQVQRIATGWRLKEVAAPMIVCTHAQTTEAILKQKSIAQEALADCFELGQAMATGLADGVF